MTISRVSSQLSQVKTDLGAAERGMKIGIQQSLEKFDTASSARLFQSFATQMQLFGADSGQRFIDDHRAQIGSLPPAQQKAFVDLLGDAKEVASLQKEAQRLSGLASVEKLLQNIAG